MLTTYAIIRESASHLAAAAERTLESFRDGRIEQEPHFTDRMLGRIEEAMDGYALKGVKWSAKTLTDHGPGSQEKTYGADFVGVLSIALQGYSVTKGFLAQAKSVEPGQPLSRQETDRLVEQCGQMLDLSPDSFVFLYSRSGIIVVPAISVVAASPRDLHVVYSRSIARFFEEHFACFIGDKDISAPSVSTLENLMRKYESRRLLHLGIALSEAPQLRF